MLSIFVIQQSLQLYTHVVSLSKIRRALHLAFPPYGVANATGLDIYVSPTSAGRNLSEVRGSRSQIPLCMLLCNIQTKVSRTRQYFISRTLLHWKSSSDSGGSVSS